MFRLLAIAPEDGWAFVRRGDELLLVTPPYSQKTLSRAEEVDLERSLGLQGFRAEDRSFADWSSLIAHLQAEIVASHDARGQAEPASGGIRELVHFAPPYILSNYLDRIEEELIPNGEWVAAQELLNVLLGVGAVRNEATLYERTRRLLESCRTAMSPG